MKPNEFVGFTLPVVNEGPWSYFSNGVIPDDGEEETMIVDGLINENDVFYLNEKSKTIYDAIASGKIVIVKNVVEGAFTAFSLITEADLTSDGTYTFYFFMMGTIESASGAADEYPSSSEDIDVNPDNPDGAS